MDRWRWRKEEGMRKQHPKELRRGPASPHLDSVHAGKNRRKRGSNENRIRERGDGSCGSREGIKFTTLCDQAAVQEGSSSFSHFLLHCASHSLFHSYIICLTLEMLTQAHLIIHNISTGTLHWRTAYSTPSELPRTKKLPNPRRDYITVWFWSNLHHITRFFQPNLDPTIQCSNCRIYSDNASFYCYPRILQRQATIQ